MLPACIWPIILGSQNLLVVGMRREKESWLTCAGRLLSRIGWPQAGDLVKVTLTSVGQRTKCPTLLYHVKCLLAYLSGTPSILSRKVETTDSVTEGLMHPELCLLIQ